MVRLLACRFCRAMFSRQEGITRCPDCDVVLEPFEDLPPSAEADLDEAATASNSVPPEDRQLALSFAGRGRLLLPGLAALGAWTFFLPWIVVTSPDSITFSGYAIALENRVFWAGFIGNLMTVPLVLTRRSVRQLAGIRIITALFSSLTLVEGLILLLNPPFQETGVLSYRYYFAPALYLAMAVSAAATVVAARLGGSTTDFRDLPSDGPRVGARRRPRGVTPTEAAARDPEAPRQTLTDDTDGNDDGRPNGTTLH